jgi:drug/metabolite transporter (DMT)-like permease
MKKMANAEIAAKGTTVRSTWAAVCALVVVNVIWGTSFSVTPLILRAMARHEAAETAAGRLSDACLYTTVRFAAALVLLGVCLPSTFRGLTRRRWLMGAAVGLPFAAGFVLQTVALDEIPPSRSGFLTSLCVVFTPLLVVALERRLPRKRVLAGIILALLGTAVLTGAVVLGGANGVGLAADATQRLTWGDVLTVAAALLFAVQIVLVDRFSRAMPPEKLTPGMFVAVIVFAAAAACCASAWDGKDHKALVRAGEMLEPGVLLLTLFASFFCTVAAFYLMNKYQGRLSPSHAALLYTLEPVFALLWALVLPGLLSPLIGLVYASERPGWSQLAGGLLIVGGTVISLLPHRPVPKDIAA